jgi:L-fuconate dehydratase
MFKQFLQAEALEFCQVDSARIGGVNEILSVYLMAKKFNGEILKQNNLQSKYTNVLNYS